MKKILKNNEKTNEYLKSLTPVYIIACWANWGIREYPFSGEFTKVKYPGQKDWIYIPLVWDYNDHNGYADQYELIRLDHTTTGHIFDWTFNKHTAEILVKYLQGKREKE